MEQFPFSVDYPPGAGYILSVTSPTPYPVMIRIKEWIIRSGLSPSWRLDMVNSLFEIGRWMKENPPPVTFPTRPDLFRHIHDTIIAGDAVDYIEFGVFKGESIRWWCTADKRKESRFFGFDTFTGLPDEWRFFWKALPPGTFDAGGRPPAIDDLRVEWITGRFQDTLPAFLTAFHPRNRLVINCDADLYTSTLYVLSAINPFLTAGSIILLDEITAVDEYRAFRDFTRTFGRTYRVVGAADRLFYRRVAVEVT